MNFVLTQFAIDSHFDPDRAGTTITDRTPEDFQREARQLATQPVAVHDGYAPFCKHLFLSNWTNAKTGTLEITPLNEIMLRSAYRNRRPEELPVLVRWFEDVPIVPRAKYFDLVLYSKEHLAEEGTEIEADWGIVAILGQLHNREEPMTPMTAMRNALGVEEGGSGVPLDREAYARSVEFWNTHAAVKGIE